MTSVVRMRISAMPVRSPVLVANTFLAMIVLAAAVAAAPAPVVVVVALLLLVLLRGT